MDKKQIEKIEIVKNYLPRCCSNPVYAVFVHGNIPKDRFQAACKSYAGNVSYEETIGFVDETFLSNGKKGCLFTFDGFYYTGCKEMVRYDKGASYNTFGSYNVVVLNEMLKKLYDVETKKSFGSEIFEIAKIVGGAVLEKYAEDAEKNTKNEDVEKPLVNETVEKNCVYEDDLEEKELLMQRYRRVKKNERYIHRLTNILEQSIESVEEYGTNADISTLKELLSQEYEEMTNDISSDIEIYLLKSDTDEEYDLTKLINQFKEQAFAEDYNLFLKIAYAFQKDIDNAMLMYKQTIPLILDTYNAKLDLDV